MSCNICENFVTFQGLTIYYETYIKLLDLFHQAFSSLNSDREPDVYYHSCECDGVQKMLLFQTN